MNNEQRSISDMSPIYKGLLPCVSVDRERQSPKEQMSACTHLVGASFPAWQQSVNYLSIFNRG